MDPQRDFLEPSCDDYWKSATMYGTPMALIEITSGTNAAYGFKGSWTEIRTPDTRWWKVLLHRLTFRPPPTKLLQRIERFSTNKVPRYPGFTRLKDNAGSS